MKTSRLRISVLVHLLGAVLTLVCLGPGLAAAESPAESPHTITAVAPTVPANGDVNPYGIVVVPNTIGRLVEGSCW